MTLYLVTVDTTECVGTYGNDYGVCTGLIGIFDSREEATDVKNYIRTQWPMLNPGAITIRKVKSNFVYKIQLDDHFHDLLPEVILGSYGE